MNDTVQLNACPNCGAPIPKAAPQGLCPKCALRLAATAEPESAPPALEEIPSPERLAAAFPQLEILELLGRGGMGYVFKARQLHLDRFVALKLLPERLARDPQFAERFSREARVLARLNHPGIVNIYDFGQAAGFYFLLMEYVDGVNLHQAMRAGRFSPAAALGIVPKICEALQYAHEQGVLHRDIKPANILLDSRGRVKIADFGIAKLVGDKRPEFNLTATGAAVGTPQYMAPEQLEKPDSVDHRADIYSLGVVFYELLTGELPIGRFAPPSQRTPLDPRVDPVVMRALEKEREKRYQSADEVKTSVEHLPPLQAPPAAQAPQPDVRVPKDFILCPPQLPPMAKALIVYGLVLAPMLWVIGLFTFDALPKKELAGLIQGGFNVLVVLGDFLFVVFLAVGSWRLRGLKPFATAWLKVALWLHLGFLVLAMAGQFWVAATVERLEPDIPLPALHPMDGVLLALTLAAVVFEISALIWLRRHGTWLEGICQRPPPVLGPHGTMVLGGAAPEAAVPKWSPASIIGAALAGLSLPLPVLLGSFLATGLGRVGGGEMLIVLLVVSVFGLPGTILGWIGLSDIRAGQGKTRGLPFAVFAALAWPLAGLLVSTLAALWYLSLPAVPTTASRLGWSLRLLIPAGAITFAVWAVYAAVRWGANRPPARQRGILKWIFAVLVLVLLAGTLIQRPGSQPTGNRASAASAQNVTLEVLAPPRETLVISGTVLSNGVPLPGGLLRARLWPPSGSKPSPYGVEWKAMSNSVPGGAPWEIVIEDVTSGTIAARLRPTNALPPGWTASPSVTRMDRLSVTREARTFEVARALQNEGEGNSMATDWSLRIQLQSSPHTGTSSRGIHAEFVLPANQVAVFELVTRSNGVIVPVPGLAAYHINGTTGAYTGTFILADDPDDLDALTGLPRWTFGIIGSDNRLAAQGQVAPHIPRDFNLDLQLWKALERDAETVEGMPDARGGGQSYGLRIRTASVNLKPGLRYSSSGFGTNWLKEAAAHLDSTAAPTGAAN